MDYGYTRSWRKKYRSRSASRGLLYIGAMDWLVGNANWEDSWDGDELIRRGQIVVGRKQLSQIWRVSEQSVRTILNNLRSDGFLTTEPTNRGTVITVTNFDIYQSDQPLDQPANQPAINQPSTTSKKGKNEEKKDTTIVVSKEKNPAESAKRFSKPSVEDVAAYCRERRNTVDPQRFWDYYESRGWTVGRAPMKDWKAAVRTWERNGNGGQTQARSGWSQTERNDEIPF